MKVLPVIAFFAIVSCKNTTDSDVPLEPLNSRDTTITLKDSLGNITLTIPNRYDTALVWTHFSDCSSCGYEKYRFQSSKLPIYLESGWIWDEQKDSIDQLTIEHSQYIRIRDSLQSTAIKSLHARMLDNAKSEPLMYQDKFRFDTIQEISGRPFSIITSDFYDGSTKFFSKAVWATTLIRGNRVEFKFNLLTKNKDSITDNFVSNSKQLLYQIKVNGL
jgi:hypothetical protein